MAFVLLATLGLLASEGLSADQSRYAAAGIADDRIVDEFLAQLRSTSARDDRRSVATLIEYPVVVLIGGLRVPVHNAAALVEHYDLIFTPELKEIIAQTGAPESRSRTIAESPVAVTSDSVVIGRNAIVIKPVSGSVKITAITVPPPAKPSSTGGAPPVERTSARRARPARQQDVRRILFRAGQSSTRFSGALGERQTDSYVVWAKQGQLLEIRIDGVQGRDVVARVRHAANQAPVDGRAAEGARVWTGRVAADADYRIEVVRLAPGGPSTLPYMLVVSVR